MAESPAGPERKGMITNRLLATVVSFFLPGIGLALYKPEKTVEGVAVFIISPSWTPSR